MSRVIYDNTLFVAYFNENFDFFRRMFPTMRVSFSDVEPTGRYAVLMDIVPVDKKRYRYAYHRSSWLVAGKADPPPPCRLYMHPDGIFSGEQLRKQTISFEKVKLTNNTQDKNGQVCKNILLPPLHNCFHLDTRRGINKIVTCSCRSPVFYLLVK